MFSKLAFSFVLFLSTIFGQDLSIFDPAVVNTVVFNSVVAQVERMNLEAEKQFTQAAANWKMNAIINRSLGLALPDKPKPPVKHKVVSNERFVYVLVDDGFVAPPVPDLDPLNVPTGGVGVQIGTTNYYQCLPGDVNPENTVVTSGHDSFKKLLTPFGCLYQKVF